jgi:molecular chaperone DnaK (HSP70)
MFRGLSPVPAGNEILFSLELDLDGILHVRAMEKRTGKEIRGVIEEAVSRSSATQISTARERVEAMWEEQEMPYDTAGKVIEIESEQASAHLPADIADVLERAAQMLDTASPEDQEEMVNLIEEIREAIDMGDIKRASARKEELDDILFYLE